MAWISCLIEEKVRMLRHVGRVASRSRSIWDGRHKVGGARVALVLSAQHMFSLAHAPRVIRLEVRTPSDSNQSVVRKQHGWWIFLLFIFHRFLFFFLLFFIFAIVVIVDPPHARLKRLFILFTPWSSQTVNLAHRATGPRLAHQHHGRDLTMSSAQHCAHRAGRWKL